jgi:hypothetical protein
MNKNIKHSLIIVAQTQHKFKYTQTQSNREKMWRTQQNNKKGKKISVIIK